MFFLFFLDSQTLLYFFEAQTKKYELYSPPPPFNIFFLRFESGGDDSIFFRGGGGGGGGGLWLSEVPRIEGGLVLLPQYFFILYVIFFMQFWIEIFVKVNIQ